MSVLLIIANTQQSSLQNYKKKQTYYAVVENNLSLKLRKSLFISIK